METHYQKPREAPRRDSEYISPLNLTTDSYTPEKGKLIREIYSNLALFEELMAEEP